MAAHDGRQWDDSTAGEWIADHQLARLIDVDRVD
jgi:hypothetical protein